MSSTIIINPCSLLSHHWHKQDIFTNSTNGVCGQICASVHRAGKIIVDAFWAGYFCSSRWPVDSTWINLAFYVNFSKIHSSEQGNVVVAGPQRTECRTTPEFHTQIAFCNTIGSNSCGFCLLWLSHGWEINFIYMGAIFHSKKEASTSSKITKTLQYSLSMLISLFGKLALLQVEKL